jgi:hypothetical protein
MEGTVSNTFLKVKLPIQNLAEPPPIEFDLYLESIENPIGIDVTANWKSESLTNTDGLFYTDANGLEFVRRKTDSYLE